MKRLTTILVGAALLVSSAPVFATLHSDKKVVKADVQDRHLSGFTGVDVSGSFDVFIKQGSSESVKVEADEEVIDRIVTEVKGGVLKIYSKNTNGLSFNWGKTKRAIFVVVKNIKSINLTGSGDVSFNEGLRADFLTLKVTGSGDISGKVSVSTLESKVTGSGDIEVAGRAETSNVSVTGSGDFSGQDLVAGKCAVQVRGSGDARVNVSRELNAAVTGSGDIQYTGSVEQVSSSKTGSGSIRRM